PFIRSGYVHQPELTQEAEFVEAPPALHDAAVADAPDVDPGKADGTARSRHAEDLTLLRTARCEMLHDQLTLADEDAHVAVPVRECGAEHGSGLSHSFAVGRYSDRWVMVDEFPGEVSGDAPEVTPVDQRVHARGHALLPL